MSGLPVELACLAAAGLVTAALLGASDRFRDRLPLDVANERSLHTGAVPRIGGMAMIAGVALALLLRALLTDLPLDGAGLPLLLALALAGLSFADDWGHLPVGVRLAGHLAAAGVMAAALDLPLALALPAWLAMAWATNLYNFMDGADGLAGGMAFIGFGAYGIAAWSGAPTLAATSLALAAAAAGFLVFNFPPARVFMGDAGSIPLGFLAAALGLLGWRLGVWSPGFPLLLFSPFIVDASVTLVRRAWRRERIWQAHRDHYYQRLVRLGWSHRRLALTAYGLMAAAAGFALVLASRPPAWQVMGLLLAGGLYGLLLWRIEVSWRRFGTSTTNAER